MNSLKNLEVTLDIDSAVKIDDCEFLCPRPLVSRALTPTRYLVATDLSFKQNNVNAIVSLASTVLGLGGWSELIFV